MKQVFKNPEWEELFRKIQDANRISGGSLWICSCQATLSNFESIREHWQRGHFGRFVEEFDESTSDKPKTES
jgi:hypothetical protein